MTDHLIANGVTFATDNNDGSKKTSEQKTKDILGWVQSTAEVDWVWMCCLKQELEQLVAIASRDNATGGKWIPVTERLPEENAVYMVSAFDGHDRRITFVQWQNRVKRWYLTGARSYWRVTHWMPLPEPPEE